MALWGAMWVDTAFLPSLATALYRAAASATVPPRFCLSFYLLPPSATGWVGLRGQPVSMVTGVGFEPTTFCL